jgi:hypothetical protein
MCRVGSAPQVLMEVGSAASMIVVGADNYGLLTGRVLGRLDVRSDGSAGGGTAGVPASGAVQLLLGSVNPVLARRAPCPLLIARAHDGLCLPGLHQGIPSGTHRV